MVVFFNGLTGVAVPVEGVYQVIVEFLVKGLYPHCCLADGGYSGKILPFGKQLHCLIDQLLVQGVVVCTDGNDPGFIFGFGKEIPFVQFQSLKTEIQGLGLIQVMVQDPGTDGLKLVNVQDGGIVLGPAIGTSLLDQQLLGRNSQGL